MAFICIFIFEVFVAAALSLHLIEFESLSPKNKENPQRLTSCKFGDVVENKCNRCVCSENLYQCTPIMCNSGEDNKVTNKKPACLRNVIYVRNDTSCICGIDGRWPHEYCDKSLGTLAHDEIIKPTCQPGGYAIIDCNVCQCTSDGEINKDKCTKNECGKEKYNSRRVSSSDRVYGTCNPRAWYSFAPCQFCYCVNENKLVCNTGNHKTDKPVEMGNYQLSVCGEKMLQDVLSLVPGAQQMLREGTNLQSGKQITVTHSNSLKNMKIPKYVTTTEKEETDININYEPNKGKDDDSSSSDEEVIQKKKKASKKSDKKKGTGTEVPVNIEGEDDVVSSGSNELSLKMDDPKPYIIAPAGQAQYGLSQPVSEPNGEDPGFAFQSVQQGQDPVKQAASVNPAINSNDQNKVVQLNFPTMLDKLLNMALRKAMVRLEVNTECEPGSTTKIKCNVCFCLVNGKMLCTDNDCK